MQRGKQDEEQAADARGENRDEAERGGETERGRGLLGGKMLEEARRGAVRSPGVCRGWNEFIFTEAACICAALRRVCATRYRAAPFAGYLGAVRYLLGPEEPGPGHLLSNFTRFRRELGREIRQRLLEGWPAGVG